jgi:hypothetical protein
MTPTPGYRAFPGENEAKLRTTINYLSAKSSAPTALGFGIDLKKFNSTRPLEAPNSMEGKTATNQQGQKIIMQNGQWRPLGR